MGGKRMRRGVRSPSSAASTSTAVLRRRLISSNLSLSPSNLDAVVNHLRSAFPDYSRIKEQTLRSFVNITLHDLHHEQEKERNSNKKSNNNSKYDEAESRLARAEAKHLMKRRVVSSNSSSDSEMSGDDSTSTSEESSDAVFEAKFEPEFDLMKSMMRDKYGKMTAKPKPKQEEDNMEIEIINDKEKMVTMGPTNKNKKSSEKSVASSENNGEVVMKDGGPRFKDLGGMNGVLEQLEQEVLVPLCQPHLLEFLGVRPMSGILLHGPPGCGKTKLAHAIANETGVPFYKISATEVVSGVSGASEENIRDLFKKAYRTAPSIVFIDEIDAIASKRENLQREMERRIVTQLMTCMDESHPCIQSKDDNESKSETSVKKPSYVLVIGATNRPDAVDQALRRPGRFDREIALGVPDENARLEILSVLIKKLRVDGNFNLMKIARSTAGFVGADLAALVNKAGNLAMKRITDKRKYEYKGEKIDDWWRQPWSQEEMESLSIIISDFEDAIKMVQPSLRREGFSAIPNTKWEDVGGLNSLRKEFDRYIIQRIKNPEDYENPFTFEPYHVAIREPFDYYMFVQKYIRPLLDFRVVIIFKLGIC